MAAVPEASSWLADSMWVARLQDSQKHSGEETDRAVVQSSFATGDMQ